jgi:hypothetical protein
LIRPSSSTGRFASSNDCLEESVQENTAPVQPSKPPVALPPRFELRCPACSNVQILDLETAVARLRERGFLRRSDEQSAEMVLPLLTHSASTWSCDRCHSQGLQVRPTSSRPSRDEDAAWEDTRPCTRCGRPIAKERIEALPNATLCIACENASGNQNEDEPQFCRHCGSIMQVTRSRRPGITRYVLECPICGS